MRIREAQPRDVDAIAFVHHESYLSGAEGLLPAATLALRIVEHWRVHWRDRVGADKSNSEVTLVAAQDSDILGFIHVSQTHSSTRVGEVNKLFVAVQHKGRGVGTALLGAGVDKLRGMGCSRAVLWSLSGNTAAAAFYSKNGWRPTGTTKDFAILQTNATLPGTEYERQL